MESPVKSAHLECTPVHGEADLTLKKCPRLSKHHAHATKPASMHQQKRIVFFWESPIVSWGLMQNPTSDAYSNTYSINANFEGISYVKNGQLMKTTRSSLYIFEWRKGGRSSFGFQLPDSRWCIADKSKALGLQNYRNIKAALSSKISTNQFISSSWKLRGTAAGSNSSQLQTTR